MIIANNKNMSSTNKNKMEKLKNEYLNLLKKEFETQKKGDIKAFAGIAMKKEQIAQQIQALHRNL